MQALSIMFGELTFVAAFICFVLLSCLWFIYVPAQLFGKYTTYDKPAYYIIGVASVIGIYLVDQAMKLSDSISINPVVSSCYLLAVLMLTTAVITSIVCLVSGKQYSFRSNIPSTNIVGIVTDSVPTKKIDQVVSVIYISLVASFTGGVFGILLSATH